MTADELPLPAVYFPIRNGRYDVSPALTPLGADHGNGERDAQQFQFDREFPAYRANKDAVRAAHPDRHVLRDPQTFDAPLAAAVTRLMASRLAAEHPALFTLSDNGATLACRLTDETIPLDAADAWEQIACQVQEDLAVVRATPDGPDRVAALHICAPSRWDPAEKIGRSFDATHAPVPGMEKTRAAAPGLVAAMIHRPQTIRLAWGIDLSDALNLHPATLSPPTPPTPDTPLTLRVERQTLTGLPSLNAALFTIRVYRYDARPLRASPPHRAALLSALHSMSPASRLYKSLPPDVFAAVVRWFES